MLEKQPPGASQFWGTVFGTPSSLANAAIVRKALYKRNEDKDTYRDVELIGALIRNQQFQEALNLYRHLAGGKKGNLLLENGSFETQSAYPPFDWQLFSTGEYGAIINDGKLELSAIRNSGDLFVRQLVKLPPRALIMEVIPNAPIAINSRLFVTLTCAETIKKPPLAIRIPIKREIQNLQIDNTSSGCRFYWLDINGRASGNGDGFDIALDSISIR